MFRSDPLVRSSMVLQFKVPAKQALFLLIGICTLRSWEKDTSGVISWKTNPMNKNVSNKCYEYSRPTLGASVWCYVMEMGEPRYGDCNMDLTLNEENSHPNVCELKRKLTKIQVLQRLPLYVIFQLAIFKL